MIKPPWTWLIIGVGLGILTLAYSLTPDYNPNPEQVDTQAATASTTMPTCKVLFVYDGDTLLCDLDGNGRKSGEAEKIRLLGIDAPEMNYPRHYPKGTHPKPNPEPGAQAATNALIKAVKGKTVWLQFDLEPSDRYGRTLAFVFTDAKAPTSVNLALVSSGLVASRFIPPNRLYEKQFQEAQALAKEQHRGLWQ